MGCDIHSYVEVQNKDGIWRAMTEVDFRPFVSYSPGMPVIHPFYSRDYRLFSHLAGVRGSLQEALSAPRGIPQDVSAFVRARSDEYGVDGHSHSWLGLDELLSCEYIVGTYFRNLAYMWLLEPGGDKELVRVVFWFDN